MGKRYITNSVKETKRLAKKLAKTLAKSGGVIALYGELGSGKTTFVKGLAKGFGIKKRIVSPTFIFIRRYEILQPKAQVKDTPGESLRATPGVEESKSARFKKTPRKWCRTIKSRSPISSPRRSPSQTWPSSEVAPRFTLSASLERFLYHIDLYRIEREEDFRGLGLEEILGDPKNIIVIEWAEKIKKILPRKRTDIFFKYLEKNKREIVFKIRRKR